MARSSPTSVTRGSSIRRGGSLTDADHPPLRGAARCAAYAAGHAACVAHVPEHDLGAAAYAIKAARAAHPRGPGGAHRERDWQRDQLDRRIRSLVLEDQTRRNDLCWRVFDD